jgi:hypothetical protein
MEIPAQALFLVLLASSAWLWCFVVFVLPRSAGSVARHRVWEVRDRLVDCIASGEIPRTDATMRFLGAVERLIINVPNYAGWMVFVPTPRHDSDLGKLIRTIHSELTDEQRRCFNALHADIGVICIRKIFFGSVSGWFALPTLVIAGRWIAEKEKAKDKALAAAVDCDDGRPSGLTQAYA